MNTSVPAKGTDGLVYLFSTFMFLCSCVKMCNDVPSKCESVGCCGYRWLTCIHALSIGQHKWREGYTGSSCRSQMNTQQRAPARWPGKPHLVADCPVVNNVRWGVHPSCSLQTENSDFRDSLTTSETDELLTNTIKGVVFTLLVKYCWHEKYHFIYK